MEAGGRSERARGTGCHVSRPPARPPPVRMRAMKVAALARAAARPSAARAMSGTPTYTGTVYKESEKARENAFFSKQDEMALRKLLTKVKSSADASCTTAGAHSAKEEAALKAIVAKYKLDAKDREGARLRAQIRALRLPRGRNGCAATAALRRWGRQGLR